MNNLVVRIEIPPHLVEPYMNRVAFLTEQMQLALENMEKVGIPITKEEYEAINFDISTNCLILEQLEIYCIKNGILEQEFPEQVVTEVNDIITKMMK